MAYSSNSLPAPERGGGAQPEPLLPPVPGPSVVPAREPQKPGRGRWVFAIIGILVLGGIAYYWKASQTTGGGPVVTVPTVVADAGPVRRTIRINGTIAARNQRSILAPRLQGSRSDTGRGDSVRITSTGRGGGGGGGGQMQVMISGGGGPQNDFSLVLLKLAKAGDRVKAGDTIAEFDPQMQVQRLDDYKDQLVQQENSLKASLASLAAQREQQTQQLRSSKASWDQRLQDLRKKDVAAKIDQETFQLAAQEAEATYKQRLETDALNDESLLSDIKRVDLAREQAKLEQTRAEQNIAKLVIKAPMDGIVVIGTTTRNNEITTVREGDEIRAGQPFMFIVDPNAMVLNGSVNQVDAEKLRLGMKARIRLDAYNDIEVPGTLEGIGAMSKTSTFRAGYVGEIPVKLGLSKMDVRIIPDLTASAEVEIELSESSIVLPREAIFDEQGKHFVYVRNPQGWTKKEVELGVTSYTKAAIKSGLSKGEVVALQRPM